MKQILSYIFLMPRRTFWLVCIALSSICVSAQDMHFSQFYETPMMLNPALTGTLNSLRGALNYKDQWRSVTTPYRTVGGSFEMRFNTNEWEKVPAHTEVYKLARRRIAGGVSFFSDRAGDGNMGLTQLQLSLSSSLPVGTRSSITAGLQGGYSQRSVNYSQLIFPEQYTGTGYDPSLSTGESTGSPVFYYGDVAGGLVWSYKKEESGIRSNNQTKFTLGASVFHLNRPRQSFFRTAGESLYPRVTLHGQLEKGFKNTNVSVLPGFMVNLQGPAKEILIGGMVRYQIRENTKYTGYIKGANLSIGGYYRNQDALITTMLLEFGNYGIGFSYDVNMSQLHPASGFRGGFEIMLKYVTPNPFLYQNRSRI